MAGFVVATAPSMYGWPFTLSSEFLSLSLGIEYNRIE